MQTTIYPQTSPSLEAAIAQLAHDIRTFRILCAHLESTQLTSAQTNLVCAQDQAIQGQIDQILLVLATQTTGQLHMVIG